MGKLFITLMLLFSTGAWAAEIYDFSKSTSNRASTTTTPTSAARSSAPAHTAQHNTRAVDADDPASPKQDVTPGSVVGSDAIAHVHNCGSAADCND